MPEKSASGQNPGKSWQQSSAARLPKRAGGNRRGVDRPSHRHSPSLRRVRVRQKHAPREATDPHRVLRLRETGPRANPNQPLPPLGPCLPAFTLRLRPCLVCRLTTSRV